MAPVSERSTAWPTELRLRKDKAALTVVFDTGEADLKPAGKQALGEVAATLRGVGGKRFQVAGHTDSEPLTAPTRRKYPTNWELSTTRAIAVVKFLHDQGIPYNRLVAAGYGEFQPLSATDINRNRRIELKLTNR